MIARSTSPTILVRRFPTVDGEFYLAMASGDGRERLVETGWSAWRERPDAWREAPRLAQDLVERLRSAIAGEEVDFRDVAIPATTPFFEACRRAAQAIPAGTTLSYLELARRAGSPAASRAAGQAMRRNPTPIVVPCHRVVSASGSLGGFAGDWTAAPRNDRAVVPTRTAGQPSGRGSRSADVARPVDIKARLLAREAALVGSGR